MGNPYCSCKERVLPRVAEIPERDLIFLEVILLENGSDQNLLIEMIRDLEAPLWCTLVVTAIALSVTTEYDFVNVVNVKSPELTDLLTVPTASCPLVRQKCRICGSRWRNMDILAVPTNIRSNIPHPDRLRATRMVYCISI